MGLKKKNSLVTEINKETANPLVSIIVITYNSSKYVLETLESAKAQTYKNIELIISDDCSTDNTVEICQNWIAKNSSKFVRTEIIKAEKNKGIAANCNQGLFKAKGEWVKFIAGDDMLLKDCIKINIEESFKVKPDVIFSKMEMTTQNDNLKLVFEQGFFEMINANQLKIVLKRNCLPAPSAFINRDVLLELNGFDERFAMVEDYPLWVKMAKNNCKMIFIEKPTVVYRNDGDGISQSNSLLKSQDFYKGLNFQDSWYSFIEKVVILEQLRNNMILNSIDSLISVIRYKIIVKLLGNKKNAISQSVYYFLVIFKPSFYKKALRL